MAQGPVQQTHFPAVSVLSLTLATSWICSQLVQVQILGHPCKDCPLPVRVFNSVMLYTAYFQLQGNLRSWP